MTIVASGYGLRENKRQKFLILVFLVPDDLKTREFQFYLKRLTFQLFSPVRQQDNCDKLNNNLCCGVFIYK